jgi:hypothetical protein
MHNMMIYCRKSSVGDNWGSSSYSYGLWSLNRLDFNRFCYWKTSPWISVWNMIWGNDWSGNYSLTNGVDKSILIDILRETFEMEWTGTTGSGNKIMFHTLIHGLVFQ